MFKTLAALYEEHEVSIWFIAMLCFLLFLWTCFMCYLPLFIKVGQVGLSIIGALGAGLMVGAAFTAVIPESISDALEHIGDMKTEEAEMSAYRLIGLCITIGFAVMMLVDSLTHRCTGHSHSHGHDHIHEHVEECNHEHCEECNHEHCEECNHEHTEECNHEHTEECNHEHTEEPVESKKEQIAHRHSYQSTVWGLCFHSIFDGVAIGATMLDENTRVLWVIFFAIVLHKSAAAFGLGAYFKKVGLTACESAKYIMIFASTTPIATFLMAMLCLWGSSLNENILPISFAFSAGTFLYVSITHIVPEIGSDLKAWHLLAMLVGILIPYFCFIDADHAGQ